MSKINHHYVPQFYLRYFASDRPLSQEPRRIHLFNIKNGFLREDVSIKDQCYKRKFYGKTDELENALAVFEGKSSWLLSQVIKLEQLPPKNLPAYQLLLDFIIVQHLRTKHEADIQNKMWDGFWKAILEEDIERLKNDDWEKILGKNVKPPTKEDLNKFMVRMKDTVIFSLSLAGPAYVSTLDDLESHLVLLNGQRHFVVSDNPVAIYNQYYEWIKESNTGLASKGIQIFLPISPHCLLVLYDKSVYHVTGDQGMTRGVSDKDLQLLNLLQFVNADQNIFFDSTGQGADLQKLNEIAKSFKKENNVKTLKFDALKTSQKDNDSVLLMSFTQTPNIHLDLSFMKIRPSARKVPIRDRLNALYRREFPDELTKHAAPPNMPKVFIRRENKGG
jgi:hypothetical protein